MNELLLDTGTYSLSYGDFFIRLLVSLGIGMVIGLERQYAAMKEGVQGYFGIRTFTFFSLLGNLSGIVYILFSPWAFIAIFLGTIILTSAAYWQAALQGDRGLTTELSALLTFVLGSLVSYGLISISLVITVVVLVFLSSKFRLRTFVGKITTEELYAFIRFVILALLLFPFLPDTPFGPYQVLYPKEIGWVILLTSGLGFLGYILIKTFGGHKGIL
ncbi:MAG: MgtC/SapB family protein, partial [Cyclobacteriaceae bacterium]|nr:MgtC/SapB family protein [Cyclobacteriaceae bacterium]